MVDDFDQTIGQSGGYCVPPDVVVTRKSWDFGRVGVRR